MATITAVSESGVAATASATLNVAAAPEIVEIDINPISIEAQMGEVVFFSAIGLLEDGTRRDVNQLVTWISSDTNVADIQRDGLAFTLNPGVTEISAVGLNGIKANAPARLTVIEPRPLPEIVEFEIFPNNIEIALGETVFYSAIALFEDGTRDDVTKRVIWSSSDPAVAVIERDGFVFSFNPGTTTISAVTDSGMKSNNESTLTVVDKPLLDGTRPL